MITIIAFRLKYIHLCYPQLYPDAALSVKTKVPTMLRKQSTPHVSSQCFRNSDSCAISFNKDKYKWLRHTTWTHFQQSKNPWRQQFVHQQELTQLLLPLPRVMYLGCSVDTRMGMYYSAKAGKNILGPRSIVLKELWWDWGVHPDLRAYCSTNLQKALWLQDHELHFQIASSQKYQR